MTSQKTRNILVADDMPVLLRFLERHLSRYGRVITAENGQMALERAQDMELDIAVLDVEMPLQNGIAVACMLLERPRPPAVILISALFNEPESAGLSIPEGIFACLAKPFEVEDLRDLVRRALDQR